MRTLKAITVAVALAITPLTMTAQENLRASFKQFLNDKSVKENVETNAYIENDEKTDKPLSYYYRHSFSLPMSSRKQLNAVLEAFRKDVGKAYTVYQRGQRKGYKGNSSETLSPFVNLAYGKNLEKRMSYGVHPDRNYNIMLVRDSQDSLCRYAYAVVWYVDSATNKLCGTLDEMYGKDPRKVEKPTFGLGSLPSSGLNSMPNASNMTNEDLLNLYNLYKMSKGGDEDTINNSIDFLKRFGNLRAAYKKNLREGGVDDTMLNTGLVNTIVELCKKHGKILSTAEQDLCVNELKELQRITDDKYLKQLLGVSIKYFRP